MQAVGTAWCDALLTSIPHQSTSLTASPTGKPKARTNLVGTGVLDGPHQPYQKRGVEAPWSLQKLHRYGCGRFGSRPYGIVGTVYTPQGTFLLPPQKSSLSGAFFLLFTLFLISALFCVSRLDFLFDGIYQPHGEKRAQRADNRATEHIRGIMHADIQPRQRNQHGKHNCGNRNFLRRA